RTYLSKGMVGHAKKIDRQNVEQVFQLLGKNDYLVGIEPSAILTFRDEYIDLCKGELKEKAKSIAKQTLLIEEFLANESDAGRITADAFTDTASRIRIHGHCFQKVLSSVVPVKKILSLPRNYTPLLIPSGCCGMAGSFGYEKEHYDISMKIGELVLFPTIRSEKDTTLISASGTSCRHQIADGTGRKAMHPVEILYAALK
ncbi:MAG TPA: FAD-binding oxidoreductase, partial [Bacteroidia bacterium]|nr:FAD-binding oxidoreductase [Bacteroidia bacterium]